MITATIKTMKRMEYDAVPVGSVFELNGCFYLECDGGNVELNGFEYRTYEKFFDDCDASNSTIVIVHGLLVISAEGDK